MVYPKSYSGEVEESEDNLAITHAAAHAATECREGLGLIASSAEGSEYPLLFDSGCFARENPLSKDETEPVPPDTGIFHPATERIGKIEIFK